MNKRRLVLLLLVSLAIITFLDRISIAVAGPRIQDALGIRPDRWGWILGAFVVHVGGGLIHLLLVIAIIVVIWNFIAGRRAV